MTDGEILTHLANIERVLTNMNGIAGEVKTIGSDVESIKKTVSKLDTKLDEVHGNTISNSKDIGFITLSIQDIKADFEKQNDILHDKFRNHDKSHIKEKEIHEKFHQEQEMKIEKNVFKSVKIWLYGLALAAVGGYAWTIITNLLSGDK